MEMEQRPARRILMILLASAGALLLSAIFAYGAWERPPELAEPQMLLAAVPTALPTDAPAEEARTAAAEPPQQPAPEPEAVPEEPEPEPEEELPEGEAISTTRQDGVYTILLAGLDQVSGNTDTIILGRIDTLKHEMDFVSIPRDTLINVDWRVRRINTVYWGSRHSDGIAALKTQVGRLAGFVPDCCAVINLEVFTDAVDLIGGVYFDVPMDMYYMDAGQDLYIDLEAGYQLLNGYEAMGLCRFRSGYVTADLGRIDMQQQFLSAVASQFLELGNIPKAPELLKLLAEGMDTDMSEANLAFLLRQYLQCRPENIRFHQVSCDTADFNGCSYVLLRVEPWLELVNEYLSPFDEEIRWRNVDIVYRSGNGVGCTGRLQDPGYYKPEPTPKPSPSPSPTPSPSPEPSPSPTPEPEETDPPGGGTEPGTPGPEPSPEPGEEPDPDPGEGGGPVIIVVQP